MSENEKTNLTLRISKEVVDKARELELNLSSITENLLKTENLVQDKNVITPNNLRKAYRKNFMHLLEILREWDIYLLVGKEIENVTFKDEKGRKSFQPMEFDYYLSPYGAIELSDEDGGTLTKWEFNEDWPVNSLFDPEKLIEILINRLYLQAKANKEKIQKLSLLQNVLEKLKEVDKGESKNDKQKD